MNYGSSSYPGSLLSRQEYITNKLQSYLYPNVRRYSCDNVAKMQRTVHYYVRKVSTINIVRSARTRSYVNNCVQFLCVLVYFFRHNYLCIYKIVRTSAQNCAHGVDAA